MVQTIVAAVDVSRASHLAFKQALVLASSLRARLVAVAVAPRYDGNMNRLNIKNTEHQLSLSFSQCLEEASEYAASLGLPIETVLRTGLPSSEIVRVAEEQSASYLVLGSPPRSQVERIMLGRTIAKVIEESPCDVLLIPENGEIRFGRTLVGVSGSAASRHAMTRAIELSREYGSELHGLAVLDVPVERSLRYGVMNEAWQKGLAILEDFTALARSTEIAVVTSLRQGAPDRCLLHYAQEKDMHLIVLGTNSQGWSRELFFDSVVERVAANAVCPVLVAVKSSPEAE